MFKLSIDDVTPGMVLKQDIYDEKNTFAPLLCEGTRVTAQFLYQLKKRGVMNLYAQKPFDAPSAINSGRRNPLGTVNVGQKSRSVIAPKTKEEVLKTMKNFQISLSGLDEDAVCEIVNGLDDILGQILSELPKNYSSQINVFHLHRQSGLCSDSGDMAAYIYRHALGVAVISMAIGQYLSLPPDEVLVLGKCASLHDIGMYLVSEEILQKPISLRPAEHESIKRHTQLGYRSLIKMSAADEEICEAILLHHERIDGSGYPLGLKGNEIPLWSKIIAVADMYDAMTSERFHRHALTPAETCEFIMGSANRTLEYDIVAALLRRIEFYPVGICVKLSNGNNAVVMENTRSKLRPTVRVLDTDYIVDLNARKNLDITILRAVSYQDIIEGR
ncbi:MAG: HD-GYP domain-containing protein [Defluviitaleaceae bacterium]|nr:HD-GYP domain-containing protein [Defluviitaleaceae bacterium]